MLARDGSRISHEFHEHRAPVYLRARVARCDTVQSVRHDCVVVCAGRNGASLRSFKCVHTTACESPTVAKSRVPASAYVVGLHDTGWSVAMGLFFVRSNGASVRLIQGHGRDGRQVSQ